MLQEAPFKDKARACVVLREAPEGEEASVAEEDEGEELREGAVVELEGVEEGRRKPICWLAARR